MLFLLTLREFSTVHFEHDHALQFLPLPSNLFPPNPDISSFLLAFPNKSSWCCPASFGSRFCPGMWLTYRGHITQNKTQTQKLPLSQQLWNVKSPS